MTNVTNQLLVKINADTTDMKKALDDSSIALKKFVRTAQDVSNYVNSWFVKAQTFGLAFQGFEKSFALIKAGVAQFTAFGDAMDKASIRMGITATSLSQLKFAAEQCGGSFEDINNGLRDLSKNLAAAEGGDAANLERLAQLDLSPAILSGMSMKDKFLEVAAPFESGRAYDPFAVYSILEAGGNFERASQQLREQGFGTQEMVDLSRLISKYSGHTNTSAATTQPGSVVTANASESDSSTIPAVPKPLEFTPMEGSENSSKREKRFRTLRYSEMYNPEVQYNAPVVHGLLREREILNVIAAPKVGKSWLALHLGLSIATGKKWLSFDTVQRRVLYVDNELHDNTHQKRTNRMLQKLGIDGRTLDTFMVETCRGKSLTFEDLIALLEECREVGFQPEVLILDAFYRMIPKGLSENDNAGITELYNYLDYIAQQYGTAIILVHHTSKGTQAGKSVTDIGSGAGAMSRASDTHMTITPHENDGLFILDAVTRSWKQPDPLVLRKQSEMDPWFIVAEEQQVKRQSDTAKTPTTTTHQTARLKRDEFAEMYISTEGTPQSAVVASAMEDGISKTEAHRQIGVLLDTGAIRKETNRKTNSVTLYRIERSEPMSRDWHSIKPLNTDLTMGESQFDSSTFDDFDGFG